MMRNPTTMIRIPINRKHAATYPGCTLFPGGSVRAPINSNESIAVGMLAKPRIMAKKAKGMNKKMLIIRRIWAPPWSNDKVAST